MSILKLFCYPRGYYRRVSRARFGDCVLDSLARIRSLKGLERVLIPLILVLLVLVVSPVIGALFPPPPSYVQPLMVGIGVFIVTATAILCGLFLYGRDRTLTGAILSTMMVLLIPTVFFVIGLLFSQALGLYQSVAVGGVVLGLYLALFLWHLFWALREAGSLSSRASLGTMLILLGLPGLLLWIPIPPVNELRNGSLLSVWLKQLGPTLGVGALVWLISALGLFVVLKNGGFLRRLTGAIFGGALLAPGVVLVFAVGWMGVFQVLFPATKPEPRLQPAEVTESQRARIDQINRLVEDFQAENLYDTQSNTVVNPGDPAHRRFARRLTDILEEGPIGRPLESYDPSENTLETFSWIPVGRYLKQRAEQQWEAGNRSDSLQTFGLIAQWGQRIVGSSQMALIDHLTGISIKRFLYDGLRTLLIDHELTPRDRREISSMLRTHAYEFRPGDVFRLEFLHVYHGNDTLRDQLSSAGWVRFIQNRLVGKYVFEQFANQFWGTLVTIDSWEGVQDDQFDQKVPQNGILAVFSHPRRPVGHVLVSLSMEVLVSQYQGAYESVFGMINRRNCLLTQLGKDSSRYRNQFRGEPMEADCLENWSSLETPPDSPDVSDPTGGGKSNE